MGALKGQPRNWMLLWEKQVRPKQQSSHLQVEADRESGFIVIRQLIKGLVFWLILLLLKLLPPPLVGFDSKDIRVISPNISV